MIWLWGWHVLESVLNNRSRRIFKIQVLKQHEQKTLKILNGKNIPLQIVDNKFLDHSYGRNHQGIAIAVTQIKFKTLKEWIKTQEKKSFLVACDLINDSYNLGAIIRSSRALGANGILVTKAKTAPFNGNLAKAAAGALESLDIIQVSNLSISLEFLNEKGYTIYGLDYRGTNQWKVNDRSVVVLGQEGSGLRNLTKKRCDHIIRIHTKQDFSVLNVSVAAGIVIYKFLGGLKN